MAEANEFSSGTLLVGAAGESPPLHDRQLPASHLVTATTEDKEPG